jgi:hypothetical protein
METVCRSYNVPNSPLHLTGKLVLLLQISTLRLQLCSLCYDFQKNGVNVSNHYKHPNSTHTIGEG